MEIEFVCLANSRKHSGRCVAGIRPYTGEWVRLVTDTEEGTLMDSRHYTTSHGEAAVLQVVRAQVTGPKPRPYQPENVIIGDGGLEFVRALEGEEAARFLSRHAVAGPDLLGGPGDRTSFAPLLHLLSTPDSAVSLALVEPQEIQWRFEARKGQRLRPHAYFNLDGREYNLSVTDPVWERRVRQGVKKATGKRPAIDCAYPVESDGYPTDSKRYFCISLGEPHKRHHYKLVAGVIAAP